MPLLRTAGAASQSASQLIWIHLFLADLLAQFTAHYPQYDVTIVKRQHADISHNMRGVDLYISYLPVPEELEDVCIMDSNPYYVSFHKDLALKIYGNDWPALEKQLQESHDLSLLKAMPFILLYDRHGQLTQDLDSIFNEYGFSPTPGFTSENGHRISVCVRKVSAVCWRPKNTVQYYFSAGKEASDMLCYPISVTSFPTYQAICYKKVCIFILLKSVSSMKPALFVGFYQELTLHPYTFFIVSMVI